MLGGVVGGVWNDCVSECWFSVYGSSPVNVGSVDSNVQEVYLVVFSHSAVNLSFGCIVLKSFNMF